MRAIVVRLGISLIALGVVVVAVPRAQGDRAREATARHFTRMATAYGLTDPSTELRLTGRDADARGSEHLRFQQYHQGLPVFEGEAISHVAADDSVWVTNNLRGYLQVSTTPRITRDTALATAIRDVSPRGAYTVRDVSLGILPRGDRSVTDRLVWQIGIDVNNSFEDPAEWRLFVDAQSGAVAFAYNDLHTADVGGTAKTMFSGDRAVRLDQTASTTYALRDLTRGGGNYTCTMNNSTISCALATTSTTTFGTGTVTTSGITAAGDAHFGMQATWDYFKNTFGRNGINNAGKRAYSRVHYGNRYENAFWSDTCFCMTYGDGSTTFQPLVSVDVAGHEMAHGVMATSANLTYSGESGGLNESSSDIFGTLVEYAVNSAADVPDYWIGERIFKANWVNGVYTQTKALRYMNDPAKDGASRACWSSGLGTIDVHYSSGPNNHMFWLLAEGGTSKCNGAVVTGIGRAKAAQIWYKAITTYMTNSTNYAGARAAALSAASALYGSTSPEKAAVAAAYSAINVN